MLWTSYEESLLGIKQNLEPNDYSVKSPSMSLKAEIMIICRNGKELEFIFAYLNIL